MDPFAQLRIWKCGGLSPLELFQRTRREFRNRQLSARCAQFAYYSMLAIMPLLIVIVVAIRYMPIEGVLGSFLNLLETDIPARNLPGVSQSNTQRATGKLYHLYCAEPLDFFICRFAPFSYNRRRPECRLRPSTTSPQNPPPTCSRWQ